MLAFEPFIDTEDLSACVEAGQSAAGLNAQAEAKGCYFPLWLDPQQSLGELFLSTTATSRSFRYGKLGDNVLGLRWALPSGQPIQVGGRVVKNVSGFDFVRFFSASQGRLGKPAHLVLRLRPKAQAERVIKLSGPWAGIQTAARAVRASSWAHALDAMDLRTRASLGELTLSYSGTEQTLGLFDQACQNWGRTHNLQGDLLPQLPEPGSQPWARAQAPLDLCTELAREWVQRYGGTVHGFLGQGLLQFSEPEGNVQGAEQGLQELHTRLAALGGHVEHPSLPPDPQSPQANWESQLLEKLGALA